MLQWKLFLGFKWRGWKYIYKSIHSWHSSLLLRIQSIQKGGVECGHANDTKERYLEAINYVCTVYKYDELIDQHEFNWFGMQHK